MRTRENHDSMVLILIFRGGDEEYKTQCRDLVSSHFLAERVFYKKIFSEDEVACDFFHILVVISCCRRYVEIEKKNQQQQTISKRVRSVF